MNTAAEIIKKTLSMHRVAEFYGFKPNRAGFISCPFHKETAASLKLYKEPGRGWYCFGCGRGSSVIDFVAQLFNITFAQAIVRLNFDFGLGLTNEKPDSRQIAEYREKRRQEQADYAKRKAEYDEKTALYRRLFHARIHKAPKSPDEPWDDEFCEALRKLDILDYYFDNNHLGYINYYFGNN